MLSKVVIFTFSALLMKVNSQCFKTVRQTAPSCNAYSPLAVTQQLPCGTTSVTTIVDNSVSNGLVNAMQLLILSNIIESQSCRGSVPQIEQDCCYPTGPFEVISYNTPCNCGQFIETPCVCGTESYACVDVGPSCPCSLSQTCSPLIYERVDFMQSPPCSYSQSCPPVIYDRVDVSPSSPCSFSQSCSPVIFERVIQSSTPSQFCNGPNICSSSSIPCNFNGESITYIDTYESC